MKNYQTIQISKDNRGVLTIRLNRPEIRNAFNEVMISDLTQVFRTEVTQPDVRVVVLRGEGTVFCAGGDLNWMRKSVDSTFEQNLQDTRDLTQMFAMMNECSKPLIGVIQGAAIGGGVGLVSVCDIALASEDAQFSLSEVRLGIVPACIGPFVIAKIGPSQARRFFVSAERFTAKMARDIGLVHETAKEGAELEGLLEKMLANMVQCGPNAITIAKRLVLDLSWVERRRNLSDPCEYVARTLAELRVSPEGQEGVRAFLEKRKPSWIEKG